MKSHSVVIARVAAIVVAVMSYHDVCSTPLSQITENQSVVQGESKEAKQQAREMKKEGWRTGPSQLPLDKQISKSYEMQEACIEGEIPKYIFGTAQSVGQTYDAAAQQAKIIARQDIAAQIESDISQLIEAAVSNNQLTATEAQSVTKSLNNSTTTINKRLTNLIPVIECHRKMKNGNIEVHVQIAYAREVARDVAIKAIVENLDEEIDDLESRLCL